MLVLYIMQSPCFVPQILLALYYKFDPKCLIITTNMPRTVLLLTFLLSTAASFHVKIANTAGKNTFAVLSCVSHEPDWNKVGPGDIANGKDWSFDFGEWDREPERQTFSRH